MRPEIDWTENVSQVELRAVDFNDSKANSDVITEVQTDEFYNLDAASSVRYSFDHPFKISQITAIVPVRILEVLRKIKSMKNIKFYQASSSEMFGNSTVNRKN